MKPATSKHLVKNNHEHSEVRQVGRFGLVGILNTLVDFIVLNILASTILPKSLVLGTITVFGISYTINGLIVAGIISGTIAMINSFIFNMFYTFKARNVDALHAAYFFILTFIGVYVFRPILLKFFTDVWPWPINIAYKITSLLHLPFSETFVERNIALAATIMLVLVYNYLAYKYIVFKNDTAA